MRNIRRSIALALLLPALSGFAADSTKELPWSSVPLEGAHLQLVSPKNKNQSSDLYFGKDGILTMTSCREGTCVGPLTAWKIENNRLKTGYAASEGAALIKVAGNRLTLREPSGEIVVYEIKSR